MTKKILILGINGFIGASLVPQILSQTDWEIYGMDLQEHKLKSSLGHARLHFTLGDVIQNPDWVEEHIKKCDIVLPLVAVANPAIYVTDPLRVFELDFVSNLSVLRQCVQYGKRIIFPSTSEVYGMSKDAVFNEETSELTQGPINKERWIYSCSKQLMDRVIYGYGSRGQLAYTLFRPFNWIGPLQDDPHDKASNTSRVVTQFVCNIIYGRDLQLVDGGEQKRCFTHINDGIDALMKILINKDNSASSHIFNIGNPKNNFSIRELAEKILALAHNYPKYRDNVAKIKIVDTSSGTYYGKGYQDLQNRVPSIENAKKYLNWEPKYTLDETLKDILDYHLS
ncbi:MAG: bifunctional UDP-4-keto-pentose/UDP-xylose synthase [Gammaproteobacteria bacterium]